MYWSPRSTYALATGASLQGGWSGDGSTGKTPPDPPRYDLAALVLGYLDPLAASSGRASGLWPEPGFGARPGRVPTSGTRPQRARNGGVHRLPQGRRTPPSGTTLAGCDTTSTPWWGRTAG